MFTFLINNKEEQCALNIILCYLSPSEIGLNNTFQNLDSWFANQNTENYVGKSVTIKLDTFSMEWVFFSTLHLEKPSIINAHISWLLPFLNNITFTKLGHLPFFSHLTMKYEESFSNSFLPFIWLYYAFKQLKPVSFTTYKNLKTSLLSVINQDIKTSRYGLFLENDFFVLLSTIQLILTKFVPHLTSPVSKIKKIESGFQTNNTELIFKTSPKNEVIYIVSRVKDNPNGIIIFSNKYTCFANPSKLCFTGFLWFSLTQQTDMPELNPTLNSNGTDMTKEFIILLKFDNFENNSDFSELPKCPVIPRLLSKSTSKDYHASSLFILHQMFDAVSNMDERDQTLNNYAQRDGRLRRYQSFHNQITTMLNVESKNGKYKPYTSRCFWLKEYLPSSHDLYQYDSLNYFRMKSLPITVQDESRTTLNKNLEANCLTSHGGFSNVNEVSVFNYLTKSASLKPYENVNSKNLDEVKMRELKTKETTYFDNLEFFFLNLFNSTQSNRFYNIETDSNANDITHFSFQSALDFFITTELQCKNEIHLCFHIWEITNTTSVGRYACGLYIGNLLNFEGNLRESVHPVLKQNPGIEIDKKTELTLNILNEIYYVSSRQSPNWVIIPMVPTGCLLFYNRSTKTWNISDGFSKELRDLKIDPEISSQIFDNLFEDCGWVKSSYLKMNLKKGKDLPKKSFIKDIINPLKLPGYNYNEIGFNFNNLDDVLFAKYLILFNIIFKTGDLEIAEQINLQEDDLNYLLIWKLNLNALYITSPQSWSNAQILGNIALLFSSLKPFKNNFKILKHPNIPISNTSIIQTFDDTSPSFSYSMFFMCFLLLPLSLILPDILKIDRATLDTFMVIINVVSVSEANDNFNKITKKIIIIRDNEISHIKISTSILRLILSSSHWVILKNKNS